MLYTPPSRKPPEQVKLLPYCHQTKIISKFMSMGYTKLHLLQTEQQNFQVIKRSFMLFLPKRSFSFWNRTKMTWVQKYSVWWKKKKVLKTGVFHPENWWRGFLQCCSFPARWFYSWTQLSSFAWFYVTLCYMFNFIDTEPFQLLRPIGIKVVSHYNKWIT